MLITKIPDATHTPRLLYSIVDPKSIFVFLCPQIKAFPLSILLVYRSFSALLYNVFLCAREPFLNSDSYSSEE